MNYIDIAIGTILGLILGVGGAYFFMNHSRKDVICFDQQTVWASRSEAVALSNPIDRCNIDDSSLETLSQGVKTVKIRFRLADPDSVYQVVIDDQKIRLSDGKENLLEEQAVKREDIISLLFSIREVLWTSADRLEHEAFLWANETKRYPMEWGIGPLTEIEVRTNERTHVICITDVAHRMVLYPEVKGFKKIYLAEQELAKFAGAALNHDGFTRLVNEQLDFEATEKK